MIAAEITTLNGEFSVTLDATAYFDQAEYEDVEKFIQEGLRGSAGSSVAQKLFNFLARASSGGFPPDSYGGKWVLKVDPETLGDWLHSKAYLFLAGQVEGLPPSRLVARHIGIGMG